MLGRARASPRPGGPSPCRRGAQRDGAVRKRLGDVGAQTGERRGRCLVRGQSIPTVAAAERAAMERLARLVLRPRTARNHAEERAIPRPRSSATDAPARRAAPGADGASGGHASAAGRAAGGGPGRAGRRATEPVGPAAARSRRPPPGRPPASRAGRPGRPPLPAPPRGRALPDGAPDAPRAAGGSRCSSRT